MALKSSDAFLPTGAHVNICSRDAEAEWGVKLWPFLYRALILTLKFCSPHPCCAKWRHQNLSAGSWRFLSDCFLTCYSSSPPGFAPIHSPPFSFTPHSPPPALSENVTFSLSLSAVTVSPPSSSPLSLTKSVYMCVYLCVCVCPLQDRSEVCCVLQNILFVAFEEACVSWLWLIVTEPCCSCCFTIGLQLPIITHTDAHRHTHTHEDIYFCRQAEFWRSPDFCFLIICRLSYLQPEIYWFFFFPIPHTHTHTHTCTLTPLSDLRAGLYVELLKSTHSAEFDQARLP